MDIFSVLNLIGGLALFLFGMESMGDALSRMAGGKMEAVLEKLTSKRIFAVLLGAGVTAVIQSSSATTVMVVGFVNSGIMQLSQAVGIIMGANIGTTMTSWILSLTGIEGSSVFIKLLKPTSFSPVLAAIGIILMMTSKEESKKKDIGGVLVGFAVLMYGMHSMSSAVSGLSDNPQFAGMLTAFSNPVLGMIAGAVLTAIIQSSSASVGMLQALCLTGVVTYSTALPIIMGQNIGTCVTAILSSIGASRNAKRASMIHLYFNLIGTIVFMIVFYILNGFLHFAFLGQAANTVGIAVIHSSFNILATICWFPFADLLVKLAQLTIPDEKNAAESGAETGVKTKVTAPDERFLERPAFAMELCRQKLRDMAGDTRDALLMALEVLGEYDETKAQKVIELEDKVDDYEDVLGSYLVKLSGCSLSTQDSHSLSLMLHSISDLERISDHAINIVESAQDLRARKLVFSKNAASEIETISRAVKDIVSSTADAFCYEDLQEAAKIEPLEQVIDYLTKKIKQHHIKRLQKGKCTIETGIILEDILTNLERVSDHCSNIAVEMLTIRDNSYDTHEYFENMSGEEGEKFNAEYRSLKEKYRLKKSEEDDSAPELSDARSADKEDMKAEGKNRKKGKEKK